MLGNQDSKFVHHQFWSNFQVFKIEKLTWPRHHNSLTLWRAWSDMPSPPWKRQAPGEPFWRFFWHVEVQLWAKSTAISAVPQIKNPTFCFFLIYTLYCISFISVVRNRTIEQLYNWQNESRKSRKPAKVLCMHCPSACCCNQKKARLRFDKIVPTLYLV